MILRVIRLLVRCALCVVGYGNHIRNGPHDCRGVCQSSGLKGGQQLGHPVPHRGDPAPSSIISETRLGGFFHAPSYGLASSRPNFPLGLPRKDV
jgi:hypothetical protein